MAFEWLDRDPNAGAKRATSGADVLSAHLAKIARKKAQQGAA